MTPDRRGSTLVVVLALLGALTIMGFLMLTVSSQEEVNAEYFAGAAKAPDTATLSAKAMFDFVLRQVILGPRRDEYNSGLWGGRHSLLPTMLGRDIHPFDGAGVHLMWNTGTNMPEVDQNYDGVADADQSLLDWNASPAANGAAMMDITNLPAPDVDYTRPDNNSPFLSVDAITPDSVTTTQAHVVRLPAFDRPQYLRNVAAANVWHSDAATKKRLLRPHTEHMSYPVNWDKTTPSTTRRFIIDAADALDPDNNGVDYDISTNPTEPHVSGPFPFVVLDGATFKQGVWAGDGEDYILNADTDGDGVNESVYIDFGFPIQQTTGGTEFFVPLAAIRIIDADALFHLNAHGNLARTDLLDFTAPQWGRDPVSTQLELISRSNQGTSRSEVNLQYGLYASPTPASVDFAGDATALATALQQHNYFFGHDPSAAASLPAQPYWELANMEHFFLLNGRAEFSGGGTASDIVELHPGRHGEANRIQSAIAQVPHQANNFPWAGVSGNDDNANADEGGIYAGSGATGFPGSVMIPPFLQPLDLYGSGTVVDASFKQRALAQFDLGAGAFSPQVYPAYYYYRVHPDIAKVGPEASGYPEEFFPGGSEARQIDEEAESELEPSLADQADSIFDASEEFGLHGHSNDIASVGYSNRASQLAKYNFATSRRRDWKVSPTETFSSIPDQFTTTSNDLKNFGKTFFGAPTTPSALRDWEFNVPVDAGNGKYGFPPQFGTVPVSQPNEAAPWLDPFRPQLRELLTVVSNDATARRPQRKMSINGVLEYDNPSTNHRLRFRPLTPHPVNRQLGRQPILSQIPGNIDRVEQIDDSPNAAVQAATQEYMARRDRQLMCRDIYVLLYTLGGGDDTKDYTQTGVYNLTDNATTKFYDENQCRAMAQFAVNLVDRLDPDDTITLFEYDTDLSNGWGDNTQSKVLDDDPYTDDGFLDRAVVYGVEEQKLAFSESLIFLASRFRNDDGMGMGNLVAENHGGTNIDDSQSRNFMYVEIENVSTGDVPFGPTYFDPNNGGSWLPFPNQNENSAWQIVVKPLGEDKNDNGILDPGEDANMNGMLDTNAYFDPTEPERRLSLFGNVGVAGGPASAGGPRFAMGTMGDTHLKDTDASPLPTEFVVRPRCGQGDEPTDPMDPQYWYNLVPNGSLNLDLLKNHLYYRVSKAPAIVGQPGEGDTVASSNLEPSSQDLLTLTPDENALLDLVSGTVSVKLELRRRADLHRQSPVEYTSGNAAQHVDQSRDNPWITVDHVVVPLQVFRIPDTITASNTTAGLRIREQVLEIDSSQRYQPLDGHQLEFTGASLWEPTEKLSLNETAVVPPIMAANRTNTIGDANRASDFLFAANSQKFSLWQSHFNRDYASVVELFDVPMYGPDRLTRSLGRGNDPPRADDSMSTYESRKTAGFVFVNPDNPDATVTGSSPGGADTTDNRWYRLFEFAGVPSRLNRGHENPWYTVDASTTNADPIRFYRDPGLINLNTVRHTAVLAGLLDDPDLMTFEPNANTTYGLQTLYDVSEGGTRDWWMQFLMSRDGVDPLNSGWIVPGLPSGRPFRSLSFSANGLASMEDTVMRSLPVDADPANGRRLFEIGTSAEHTAGQVDPTVRHRLLQKVMNNTTTRSNVFLVFVQIDYFEAVEVTDPGTGEPVVRIGAKRATPQVSSDSPAYRAFFVVDRSKAMELLEPQHLPSNVSGSPTEGTFSFDPSFNYQALILHRQTIK